MDDWKAKTSATNIINLESQNKAHENSNIDCLRRIKMLEYALRQERIKYARSVNGIEGKFDILKDYPDTSQVENLPERPLIQKSQGHQSILIKFLEEMGFEDVFNAADVNDIKDLFNKATSSLSKNQDLLDTVTRIEEEVKKKVFKEENKIETLEEQLKEINENGELSSNIAEHEDNSKNCSEHGEDCACCKDNFNTSFDSVQKDDDSSKIIQANYSDKMSEIKLKHEFNVHLDSVRGVQFIGSLDCMASVSEDCTVKLWDVKLMHK